MDIAEKDKNVVLITGDLGFGVLKPFWEKFPDQFPFSERICSAI